MTVTPEVIFDCADYTSYREVDDTAQTVTYRTVWKTGSDQANAEALRTKAQQALTTNATYLGRTNPTTAQNTAQVQALTRQVNALIRLALGLLDDTSGT